MSDHATQLERACGAGYSATEAKALVNNSQRIEADIEDLEPAAEIVEQLSTHAARLLSDAKTILPSNEVVSVLNGTLNVCEAFEHLFARAKASDKQRATELLNQ